MFALPAAGGSTSTARTVFRSGFWTFHAKVVTARPSRAAEITGTAETRIDERSSHAGSIRFLVVVDLQATAGG
ncbi:hypothetical protein GGTG_03374 [Gaeumannomyces tritici R3-111a-1]|uniref:Uncharacterized protein n=1 Tax=Gaeumannomyces tritici (strain R3-111a-1) TaxID=644352 RepID=J3NQ16_GAET3|nr:hypothetical protein GGTG_03374 [Gaeumannomyces tritici R3-111a-1]EJT78272.1 hypothetical protein GGTG_03374 [Gaeumannomyces tritici R3-111a-1]